MSAAALTVVWADHRGSDWLGIYRDGDRIYEGHPPEVDEVFDLLGVAVEHREIPSDSLRVPGVRGLPLRLPRTVS